MIKEKPSSAVKTQLLNALDSARAAIKMYQAEVHPTTLAFDLSKWADHNIEDLAKEVEGT